MGYDHDPTKKMIHPSQLNDKLKDMESKGLVKWVDEPGCVGYVTTRLGNLVEAGWSQRKN